MNPFLLGILGVIAVERLVELGLSRRNQDRLLARGGQMVEGDGFTWLAGLHTAWLTGMLAEHLWAPWASAWVGTWVLLAVFVAAEGLRWWSISTLGERWTTKVIVLPGEPRVRSGPYRWLAHPNYVAVSLQIAALPLAFGLWTTAIVASGWNLLALRHRISIEDAALNAVSVDA